MNWNYRLAVAAMAMSFCVVQSQARDTPSAPAFKEELRMPWSRSSTDFIRTWMVAGPIPCRIEDDCLGGEATARPTETLELKQPDGSVVKWRSNRTWGDHATIASEGATDGAVGYAHAIVTRARAGKALLSLGSDGGIRAWVNGKQVLARDGVRAWSRDNDLVEVDLVAGDNTLLIKVGASAGFAARVLEAGAVAARVQEIAPVIRDSMDTVLTVATDASGARAAAEPVKIEVIRAGGEVVFEASAPRGEMVRIDSSRWPEGPYEARFTTPNAQGLVLPPPHRW